MSGGEDTVTLCDFKKRKHATKLRTTNVGSGGVSSESLPKISLSPRASSVQELSVPLGSRDYDVHPDPHGLC